MKQNLLKYGLVMVLAMIASTGLLWADVDMREYEKDTTVLIEKSDSLPMVSLQVKQHVCLENNSADSLYVTLTEPAEETEPSWFVKTLQCIKEYKKEFLLCVVCCIFVLAAFIELLLLFYLPFRKSEKIKDLLRKGAEHLLIMLFVILTLATDSSWFYLIVVAIILYYAEKNHLTPDLMTGIKDIIKMLQGKLDIKTATKEEVQQKHMEEAKEDISSPIVSEQDKDLLRKRASEGESIERLALGYYRRQYPALRRSVGIMTGTKYRLLDGLVLNNMENIIFEIKYCTNPESVQKYKIDYLHDAADQIQKVTGVSTNIILCIVVPDEEMKERVYKQDFSPENIQVDIYSINDLEKKK